MGVNDNIQTFFTNGLLNNDSNCVGLYRAYLMKNSNNKVVAFVPGLDHSRDKQGKFDASAFTKQEYIDILPEVQWCAFNKQSCVVPENDVSWVMFENGDAKRPVVMTNYFIGGGGTTINPYTLTPKDDKPKMPTTTDPHGGPAGMCDIEDGTEVDALFTAYYATPDDYSSEENRREGGPKDCFGRILNHENYTCAAPPEIVKDCAQHYMKILDFDSEFDHKESDYVGNVYACTDVGGAVQIVKGVYHFDILFSDRESAYEFGEVTGKALIGTKFKELISDTPTDVASRAVALAIKIATDDNSDNTSKWTYSGKNRTGPYSFDCSGFIWYCYNNSEGGNLTNLQAIATAGMETHYKLHGFESVTDKVNLKTGEGLLAGDIMVAPGDHTEMCAGVIDGVLKRVGAHTHYTQSAKDITVEKYSSSTKNWSVCLRYVGD